jgi:uncharacterized SAM-binding protein YcdF (DUF218 family)
VNWRRAIEAAVTPPGLCLLLLLAGMLLRSRRPRAAMALSLLGIATLWLASTPAIAGSLLRTLQSVPPLPATGALPTAQAIVVLSAEADREAPEFGGASVGALTLVRIRYAAALHRRTKLPVLTSGGRPGADLEPIANTMAEALTTEFSTPVRWREDRSKDTFENAKFSAELLKKDGVRTVLLVTHAWHLPRAIATFEAHGLEAIGAGTAYRGEPFVDASSWLPQASALRDTTFALHEWLGRAAYSVRR